jgi:hypothetical protein
MDGDRGEMTAAQYKALKKSAAGYWGLQFGACIVMMLIFAAGVVAAWGYGIGFTDGSDTPAGDGLMSLLCFGAFFGCFLYLWGVRRKSTGLGRLRYAWVIRQTERAVIGNLRSVPRDTVALGLAEKASQGKLTAEDLAMLQGLDPDLPYPWRMPTGQ